jgi:hypothetical protein
MAPDKDDFLEQAQKASWDELVEMGRRVVQESEGSGGKARCADEGGSPGLGQLSLRVPSKELAQAWKHLVSDEQEHREVVEAGAIARLGILTSAISKRADLPNVGSPVPVFAEAVGFKQTHRRLREYAEIMDGYEPVEPDSGLDDYQASAQKASWAELVEMERWVVHEEERKLDAIAEHAYLFQGIIAREVSRRHQQGKGKSLRTFAKATRTTPWLVSGEWSRLKWLARNAEEFLEGLAEDGGEAGEALTGRPPEG